MDATNGVDELVEHDPTEGSHVEHGVVEHPSTDDFGDLRGLIEKLDYLKSLGVDCLCVNNLSRFPQPTELNLQHWTGYTPVEMTGYVEFPPIGQLPYLLKLRPEETA
jgi:hypothetical protein